MDPPQEKCSEEKDIKGIHSNNLYDVIGRDEECVPQEENKIWIYGPKLPYSCPSPRTRVEEKEEKNVLELLSSYEPAIIKN